MKVSEDQGHSSSKITKKCMITYQHESIIKVVHASYVLFSEVRLKPENVFKKITLQKKPDPLLWHLKFTVAHEHFHLSESSSRWLELTCDGFNLLDLIWKGTHLSIIMSGRITLWIIPTGGCKPSPSLMNQTVKADLYFLQILFVLNNCEWYIQ